MKKKYFYIPIILLIGTIAFSFQYGLLFDKNTSEPNIIKLKEKQKNNSINNKKKDRSLLLNGKAPYIVIDRYANKLYLRTQNKILLEAICSTGTGKELSDTIGGRSWTFDTPEGLFTVDTKLENPWWRKPDWAFIEEGEAIPKDDRERFDSEMLGEFAIGFGDGYFIHGTLYVRLLGINVTHGCVRLGEQDLKFLYNQVKIGTRVYVY